MIEPKTWTDNEIVDLMFREAIEYKRQATAIPPGHWTYREMMECVLHVLKKNHLIEDTP